MDVGFKTDKGIRRANNEDAFFVLNKDKVFIVADGVGGSNSGEIASRTAVNEVVGYIEKNELDDLHSDDEIKDYFFDCLKYANYKVLDLSQRYDANKGMATTMVLAYIRKDELYVLNVGDSRAYLFRDNDYYQITEDHTFVNTLLKAGMISPEKAKSHEDKHMITRAIGAEHTVEVDFFKTGLQSGDVILLCTDGMYDEVDESEMVRIIDESSSMSDACSELVELANSHGGHDNITVICIKIMEEDF